MSDAVKVGVILGGCGRLDGSEIHEATCTLLAIDQQGGSYQCYAPDKPVARVVNHLTGEEAAGEGRNMMIEAARIARGDIKDLGSAKASDCDAWVMPGGDGIAHNLCTFGREGAECSVDGDVHRVILEARDAGLPLGFVCIAPAIGARVLGERDHPKLTIGHNAQVNEVLGQTGAAMTPASALEIVVDEPARVVSTPAYMEAKGPAEVYTGVSKLVEKVLELARQPAHA
ncbi:MAG: isoprenoid biosynthesis glyoxalase ElbB [Planctomycetota bacterium]